jgi:putative ABC transport system ATP-binding protein
MADSPAAPPASVLVTVRDVTRTYGRGATAVHALRAVSLTVAERQLVAVRGRSGSGKTTLLNIVGGLDTPTSGTVQIAGRDVTAMTERERLLLRRSTVAFI